uniref:EF-hand domain-containing protein n=1 Tax=Lactuca sativa TaxID=4236 RepID=A0A9R1VB07_LACSA|nr:hypothetical protein LSAT_V11C600325400 [Lactuca sativa]
MGCEDFVCFILSEEDKSSGPHLDGNGVLTRNELQFFYEEQLHRMECMAQESVLFQDILCQIRLILHYKTRKEASSLEALSISSLTFISSWPLNPVTPFSFAR